MHQIGTNFNKWCNLYQNILTEGENLLVLDQILTKKSGLYVYEWITFARKLVYVGPMGSTFKFSAGPPGLLLRILTGPAWILLVTDILIFDILAITA